MLKIIKICYKIPQNVTTNGTITTFSKIRSCYVNSSKTLKQTINFKSNFCTSSTVNIEKDKEPTSEYPDLSELIKGDEQLDYKYKLLQLEIEVMRQNGNFVPSIEYLKRDYWVELLSKNSRSSRSKYLTYLFKLEMKKNNDKERKLQKAIEKEEFLKNKVGVKDGEIRYGLSDNGILIRIRDTTINRLYNNKLIQAMQFGEKLVFDCGFDNSMSPRENSNCAKQLMFVFAENRTHDDPYDIHFCNFNQQSIMAHHFHKNIPTMHEPWFPINIHEESYLDLFPKENLVYLTPHCQQELVYNPNDIYIVGSIVDKMNNEPVSLAKAKKEGLRMAKFPLERYLDWGAGSGKSLALNQVLAILLDLKKTKDWKYSLRHVPRRKLFYDETENNRHRFDSLRYDKPEGDNYESSRRNNWKDYNESRNQRNNYTKSNSDRRNQSSRYSRYNIDRNQMNSNENYRDDMSNQNYSNENYRDGLRNENYRNKTRNENYNFVRNRDNRTNEKDGDYGKRNKLITINEKIFKD